ncbi:tRNA nucleotidyltransferase/poly(A) polymerase family protein [gut metagenome]|uniref:tRNA nucleotidyltransferase/poly(A) polymerase family protein n=1 Tax=gut metagenome TaxID=749906 RepID=J9GIL9_9ZZZZ
MNLVERIPPYSKKILAGLEAAGFEAYLVGGAVRDLLLNLTPGDYDITTNARPEQVLELCRKLNWFTVKNLGNNFGCVVIVLDGVPTEVTTFRGESYGTADAHRPEKIWYCQKLEEDLSRRDFTVNAMAMDLRGKVYDFFGGKEDLQNKILRTVGNAAKRYQEDGLRMFRACRFVAQLGFTYVQENDVLPAFGMKGTPYYLPQNYKMPLERCNALSLERVRQELDKLLLSPFAGHGLMLL